MIKIYSKFTLLFLTVIILTFFSNIALAKPLKDIDNYLQNSKPDSSTLVERQNKVRNITNSKQITWGSMFVKTGIVLVVIITLIYLIVYFFKKSGNNRIFGSVLPSDLYKILGSAPLTYNKYLTTIRFYDTVYILAISENEVSVVDKISDPEKITEIENLIPYTSSDMPDKFLKLLKKNIKTLNIKK